jgi:hypothetical protein
MAEKIHLGSFYQESRYRECWRRQQPDNNVPRSRPLAPFFSLRPLMATLRSKATSPLNKVGQCSKGGDPRHYPLLTISEPHVVSCKECQVWLLQQHYLELSRLHGAPGGKATAS